MGKDLIIGVDAGTSVIKAVAFDLNGHQVAMASTPNQVMLGPGGAAEQDMDATWVATAGTLRALADKVSDLAQRTVAMAATGQGDGTWLIDADGKPVGPAMLWLDARAASYVDALRNNMAAQAVAARAGTALTPSIQSMQLLWLRERHPERLAHARTAFHCKDWLFFKATDKRATSACEGAYTFGNLETQSYDDVTLALLGLSDLKRLLPPLSPCTGAIADLTQAAADETGLTAGTPVVLPLMDVPLTLLGSGGVAFSPDGLRRVGCSVLGSTGMHGWMTQDVNDLHLEAQTGYTIAMPWPGMRVRLVSHMAATLNVDWLLALVADAARFAGSACASKVDLLTRLDSLVLQAAPAQAVYHPYIAENGERGPFVDAGARAQLSGFSARLGLSGLARAVFEGVALATRDCYEALGPLPEEIRLSGGAARSPALRQLLASVTGRPVRVSYREECGAAGAAVMAAVAIGRHSNVREALPQWVDAYLDNQLTLPDPQQTALYDALYLHYRDVAARARPAWQDLSQIRNTLVPRG